MDIARFDSMLALRLGDTGGSVYSANTRAAAMSEAVRAYSRFYPLVRRIGTGAAYANTAVGATTIYTVGGPFAIGDEIVIDPNTPWSETKTITNLTRPAPSDNLVGSPLVLTVSAMTYAHYAGAIVTKSTPVLNIVSGQDTYPMPYDFIEPDRLTFGLAVGSREWIKREESFYDGVFRMSERIGGVGFGLSQTFRGSVASTGGFVALPSGVSGLVVPSGGQTRYQFLNNYPIQMQVLPEPTASDTLDFNYNAEQIPETIPDSDLDALLSYAHYAALASRAASLGGTLGDWTEADVKSESSKNAQALMEMATKALMSFDRNIRRRPRFASG